MGLAQYALLESLEPSSADEKAGDDEGENHDEPKGGRVFSDGGGDFSHISFCVCGLSLALSCQPDMQDYPEEDENCRYDAHDECECLPVTHLANTLAPYQLLSIAFLSKFATKSSLITSEERICPICHSESILTFSIWDLPSIIRNKHSSRVVGVSALNFIPLSSARINS